MITRQGEDQYYLVTNAARRERDTSWIASQVEKWNAEQNGSVTFETLDDHALVALQGVPSLVPCRSTSSGRTGPEAAKVLTPFFDHELSLNTLRFGQAAIARYDASDLHVARSGYTGEDGFEVHRPLSLPALHD